MAGRTPQPTPMLVPVAGATPHGLLETPSPEPAESAIPAAGSAQHASQSQAAAATAAARPTSIPRRPYQRSAQGYVTNGTAPAAQQARSARRQGSDDVEKGVSGQPSVSFSERMSVRYTSRSPVRSQPSLHAAAFLFTGEVTARVLQFTSVM